MFWNTLDRYAQQHTVDAYRFEVGHVSDPIVQQNYINNILNKVDNCLARRVAFGIGVPLPTLGSGPKKQQSSGKSKFPSLYPLVPSQERKMSNEGLIIGILGGDDHLSTADLAVLKSILAVEKVSYKVIASHIGGLKTGVPSNQSFITTSSVFYDAIILGSSVAGKKPDPLSPEAAEFLREAYSHGKAIAAIGSADVQFKSIGIQSDPALGVFQGAASAVSKKVLAALSGPVRFPQRFPTDDLSICEHD